MLKVFLVAALCGALAVDAQYCDFVTPPNAAFGEDCNVALDYYSGENDPGYCYYGDCSNAEWDSDLVMYVGICLPQMAAEEDCACEDDIHCAGDLLCLNDPSYEAGDGTYLEEFSGICGYKRGLGEECVDDWDCQWDFRCDTADTTANEGTPTNTCVDWEDDCIEFDDCEPGDACEVDDDCILANAEQLSRTYYELHSIAVYGCIDSVCGSNLDEGDDCVNDSDCEDPWSGDGDFFCSPDAVCELDHPKNLGEACDGDADCMTKHFLDGPAFCVDFECAEITAAGDSCHWSDEQCQDALYDEYGEYLCVETNAGSDYTCELLLDIGDPCDDNSDCEDNVHEHARCEFAADGDYRGTCQVPEIGDQCYYDWDCSHLGYEVFCNDYTATFDNYGVCYRAEVIGDECKADDDCVMVGRTEDQIVYCDHTGDDIDDHPTCQLFQLGMNCDEDDDCEDLTPLFGHLHPFCDDNYVCAILELGDECEAPVCDDSCGDANDGWCDDGGIFASYSSCSFGTDCSDCGARGECGGEFLFCNTDLDTPLCEIEAYHGDECYSDIQCWPDTATCETVDDVSTCVDPDYNMGDACEVDDDCSDNEMCVIGACVTAFSVDDGEACGYADFSYDTEDEYDHRIEVCASNANWVDGTASFVWDYGHYMWADIETVSTCRPVDTNSDCKALTTEPNCLADAAGCSWHAASETCVQFQCVAFIDGWNDNEFCSNVGTDSIPDFEFNDEECDGYCGSDFTCVAHGDVPVDERCDSDNYGMCADDLVCVSGDSYDYYCKEPLETDETVYDCEDDWDCAGGSLGEALCAYTGKCKLLADEDCTADCDCYELASSYDSISAGDLTCQDGTCGWAWMEEDDVCESVESTLHFVTGEDGVFDALDSLGDVDIADMDASMVTLIIQGFCCVFCDQPDMFYPMMEVDIDCSDYTYTAIDRGTECPATYADFTEATITGCDTFEDFTEDDIPDDLEGDLCNLLDCGRHGTCSDGECDCSDDYTGSECQFSPLDLELSGSDGLCASVDCGPNGECDAVTAGCNCNAGWVGASCSSRAPATMAPTPAPTPTPATDAPGNNVTDAPTDAPPGNKSGASSVSLGLFASVSVVFSAIALW